MTPWLDDGDVRLYHGDCLEVLRQLPDRSVHMCATSPPFYGLRDYGTGSWEGGDPDCDHATGKFARNDGDRNGVDGFGGNQNRDGHANMGALKFRDACGKCGARRVDRQIGLEETPDQWVERLVEVFREVRRVLRDDGTLWVEIGDSYCANVRSGLGIQDNESFAPNSWSGKQATQNGKHPTKQKDLLGQPWMLAKALRDPYFTGQIKSEADRVWLAAMVDGEGCIAIHKRPAGTKAYSKFTKADGTERDYLRKTDSYQPKVEITNTSRAIMDRVVSIAGGNCDTKQEAGTHGRKQTIYRWTVTADKARDLLRELYPHLVGKQHEARLAHGCPSSGDGASEAHESLKALHRGDAASIDFAAPETMWEAGWFLRSEIIWARLRPNPMPESVTDRPTKAHSTVFLLSKQPRYFFDADAIREPSPEYTAGWARSVADRQHGNGETSQRGEGGGVHRMGQLGNGANARSVWQIPTEPTPFAHFATWPQALVRRMVLAGTSERGCCPQCGAPWVRDVERDAPPENATPGHITGSRTLGWSPSCACDGIDRRIVQTPTGARAGDDPTMTTGRAGMNRPRGTNEGRRPITRYEQARYAEQLKMASARPQMEAEAGEAFAHYIRTDDSGARPVPDELLDAWVERNWIERVEVPNGEPLAPAPCTVLDPFAGSATTCLVARNHGRHAVGIELNEAYLEIAAKRLQQLSLLTGTDP